MKQIILLIILSTSFLFANAQSLPDFSSISLKSEKDYNAGANDAALKAATYILSTPPDKENATRRNAGRYLMTWMTGTPDYAFAMDAAITKLTTGNPQLMMVTIAAMTEFVLKNKADKDDVDKIKLNAVKTLVKYVTNSANKIKAEGELQKAIAADKKGKLAEFLVKLNK